MIGGDRSVNGWLGGRFILKYFKTQNRFMGRQGIVYIENKSGENDAIGRLALAV